MIPAILSEPYLVIGEGPADTESISHLAMARNIAGYQVGYPELPVAAHGRTGFGDLLAALATDSDLRNVRAIAIAYDNDSNPDGAFHHVQQSIRGSQSGYSVPAAPLEAGPAVNNVPAIVALPIPWVNEIGCLESLILPAVTEKWPEVRRLADGLIAATRPNDLGTCKGDKAILAALVACVCRDPTCSVRSMWSRREFRDLLGHTCFDRVAEFLRDLPAML